MNHFVTYFDMQYAARGLALLESLWAVRPAAQWTVLCLGEPTEQIVRAEAASRVTTVTFADLAGHEPRLLSARAERTPWELYATLKPVLLDWVLRQAPAGELITYIDADTWFFSDPAPALAAANGASVAISPHRFAPEATHLACYGRYNAGFGAWRNDAVGRACVQDWAERCLGWCYGRVDGTRFMDQGYLNDWPAQFSGVAVLPHPGHNLAPWNVGAHQLTRGARGILVDKLPLVFFHFSSLFRDALGAWQTIYTWPALRQPIVHHGIYLPYLAALDRVSQRLLKRHGVAGQGSVRTPESSPVWEICAGRAA